MVVALLTGCSPDSEPGDFFRPSDTGTLVVDAVLLVSSPFPDVYVSRTVSPDEPVSSGVEGAVVRIEGDGQVIDYAPGPGLPGRYVPTDSAALVRPATLYELSVVTEGGERVGAVTTTPEAFQVEGWVVLDEQDLSVRQRFRTFDEMGEGVYEAPENRVVYADGLLEARFLRPSVPAFQVGIESLDLDSPFVIDPDFFEEEDFEELERKGNSPPLEGSDGSLRLPWFAIYFEGRYVLRIFALDENWYDLIRSSPELGDGSPGFGGNLGDNFDRPIFHIDGGIGLFGSASVDSIGFVVQPG
jgi:hypothetical protein